MKNKLQLLQIKKDVEWYNHLCDFYIQKNRTKKEMQNIFIDAKQSMAKEWGKKQKQLLGVKIDNEFTLNDIDEIFGIKQINQSAF